VHGFRHPADYNEPTLDFVTNNWHLIALAFVSGGMLLWPMVRQASAGGATLSTLQATHLINREDALVIDVRDAAEFAKGRILGAKSLPLADLERRAAEFAKHKAKPVIVSCDGGTKALGAIAQLKKLGFEKVFALSGGYGAWQQAGLPTEK
jgi:rhodanese-related sulfurtransferase